MNLIKFLEKVDSIIASYNKETLASCIHEVARKLPEKMRNDFIVTLERVSEDGEYSAKQNEIQNKELKKQYEQVKAYISEIEEGECLLQSEWEEGYYDWMDDGELYYTDPDGIGERIDFICNYIHRCTDANKFDYSAEIGRKLIDLEIMADSDWGTDNVPLSTMTENKLIKADMRKTILDTLYSCYMVYKNDKLSEVLYEILASPEADDLCMEDLLQRLDKEMDNFDVFLADWISYLGNQTGKTAESLYTEAVELSGNIDEMLKISREHVDIHPGMYCKLLENTKIDKEKLIKIGFDGIERIDKAYIIRSETALRTAELICENGKDNSNLYTCYKTAFDSDSNAVNYFRCFFNTDDKTSLKQDLDNFCKEHKKEKNSDYGRYMPGSERELNRPEKNMVYILRILNGDIQGVLSDALSGKTSLGWTESFMKKGIAIYLLCIYDEQMISPGMEVMLNMSKEAFEFTIKEYMRGQHGETNRDEKELFYDCFLKWKNTVSITDEEKKEILSHIEKVLEKRVAAIMEANRRNYYGECAAFIAAVGEVKEAQGKKPEKQRYMSLYKEKYGRRHLFVSELKKYGWIKL